MKNNWHEKGKEVFNILYKITSNRLNTSNKSNQTPPKKKRKKKNK